jgi:hypothetical protein
MSTDTMLHLAEIVVLGLPLWFGVIRFFFIFREYPPHVHESNGVIRYPSGYEPGVTQKLTNLGGK